MAVELRPSYASILNRFIFISNLFHIQVIMRYNANIKTLIIAAVLKFSEKKNPKRLFVIDATRINYNAE